MSMFLSQEEVAQLTGKKRRPAQVLALKTMGVEHIERPDGAVIVSRSHIERLLAGIMPAHLESGNKQQPNWEAI